MTVTELIRLLQAFPGDAIVMAHDGANDPEEGCFNILRVDVIDAEPELVLGL